MGNQYYCQLDIWIFSQDQGKWPYTDNHQLEFSGLTWATDLTMLSFQNFNIKPVKNKQTQPIFSEIKKKHTSLISWYKMTDCDQFYT